MTACDRDTTFASRFAEALFHPLARLRCERRRRRNRAELRGLDSDRLLDIGLSELRRARLLGHPRL